MRKRGQMMGMPIMYILIVLIMALILFFGFKSVNSVLNAKEVTQISKFVLDFQDEVELIYSYDIGSAKTFRSIALPNKVTHVCFYNPSKEITSHAESLFLMDDFLHNYLDVSLSDNLFLVPTGEFSAPYPDYYVEYFKVNSEENPLCVQRTKKGVEVILESYLDEREVYVGVKRV
jgi:hypothetical protein